MASEPPLKDKRLILVGHSMGGRVIPKTAEARPDRIKLLVYLTANLFKNGEAGAPLVDGVDTQAEIKQYRIPSADGLSTTNREDMIGPVFYHDCSDGDIAWAKALLVPQAAEPMARPMQTTDANWGRVPRVYIECLQDRTIPIALQREMVRRIPVQQVYTLDTSHSPFVSAPVDLARILTALA